MAAYKDPQSHSHHKIFPISSKSENPTLKREVRDKVGLRRESGDLPTTVHFSTDVFGESNQIVKSHPRH